MNYMKALILSSILSIFGAPAALGRVNLEATCSGGEAHLRLVMSNSIDGGDVGLVIYRSIVGLCDEPVLVTDEPIMIPPDTDCFDPLVVDLTVPAPIADVVYRFEAKYVDSNMNPISVPSFDCWYHPAPSLVDHASEDAAVIMRGRLTWSGPIFSSYYNVYVTPCEDDCWGQVGFAYQLLSLEPIDNPMVVNAFQHQLVDVIGLPFEPSGMADSGIAFVFSEIRETDGGSCGPVPNRETSWGSFKARYR